MLTQTDFYVEKQQRPAYPISSPLIFFTDSLKVPFLNIPDLQ